MTRRDGSGISTPAVDDRLEGAVPVVAEVDVVVAQVRRRRPGGAHVPHHRGGGEVAGAHRSWGVDAGQQPVVGDREVEGAHHGVGGDAARRRGGDADHGTVGAPQHLPHLDAEVDRHPGVGERLRHAPGHRVHAAVGVEDPAHGVHVRDDGEHGPGLGGGDARVEGLEAEDAGEPVVGEEPVDGRAEPAEPAELQQPGRRGGGAHEVERRGVVVVDEGRELGVVELLEPHQEPVEPGRVGLADLGADLLAQVAHVGADVQLAAVGVDRAGRPGRGAASAPGPRGRRRSPRWGRAAARAWS